VREGDSDVAGAVVALGRGSGLGLPLGLGSFAGVGLSVAGIVDCAGEEPADWSGAQSAARIASSPIAATG